MWIALNPEKAHRFTTKGINLSKAKPAAYVPPELEPQFLMRINTALAAGEIIRIDGKGSFKIEGQAEVSEATRTENDDYKIRTESVKDPDTNRITATIIKMPDEDGNTDREAGPTIIMTGIQDLPLEDE